MTQFSKYFKYFLLIIIFVIPVAVLADDLPVFKNCTVSPSGEIPAFEDVIISGSVYDDCASGVLLVVDIFWGDGVQDNRVWTCITGTPIEENFLNEAEEPHPAFKHKYTTPGEYEISLYASDSNPENDESSSWSRTINIGLANPDNRDDNGTGPGLIQITNPLSATDFKDFIDKLVRFLFTICLIVVPILLVVAGIMFITSQGDPEKARKARKMILFTLIGFAIISLARIFVSFIEQIFK